MSQPKQRLYSIPLKNALKAHIVPVFSQRYNVCAVRTLWENHEDIYHKILEMEMILKEQDGVVAFFSCVTAMKRVSEISTFIVT